jgi:hypothetical protein
MLNPSLGVLLSDRNQGNRANGTNREILEILENLENLSNMLNPSLESKVRTEIKRFEQIEKF